MSPLASALVNVDALWKIVLAALVGGGGLVIVYALLLLGLGRVRSSRRVRSRLAHSALAVLCALFCVGAVALGIYAMADKPQALAAAKQNAPGLAGKR